MDSYYGIIIIIFWLIITVLIIASFWKVFVKAGKPGWASLIPFYNYYVLVKIAKRPGWWVLLILFIPFVNIVMWLVVSIDIAKAFGKSTLFGVLGLFLFAVVGYPILAFGDSEYTGGEKANSIPANPSVPASEPGVAAPLVNPPQNS